MCTIMSNFKDFKYVRNKLEVYSDLWWDYKLNRYSNKDLENTREYLIEQLKENPDFIAPIGILLKEDFIEKYYESRELSGKPIYNYDFSKLPDIIKNRKTDVIVGVNEINERSREKIIADWKISFKEMITDGRDYRKLSDISRLKTIDRYTTTQSFIKKAIDKFGTDVFGYDKTKYVDSRTSVEIYCKKCNTYFWQKPWIHLNCSGYGCPKCTTKVSTLLHRTLTKEEFCNRLDNIFGKGHFDYSKLNYVNTKTPVIVINSFTGEEYERLPYSLLSGYDPKVKVKSNGEILIENWFLNHPELIVKKQVYVDKIHRKDTAKNFGVFIDFVLVYKDNTILLEYNGIQHYKYLKDTIFHSTYQDFLDQVNRDINVRNYCKLNNYLFIELPYTYSTQAEINDVLDKIILCGISPEDVIKIPEIKIEKGGSEDGRE